MGKIGFKQYSRKDKIKIFLLYNAYFGAIMYLVSIIPLSLASTLDLCYRYGVDISINYTLIYNLLLGTIFLIFIIYLGIKEIQRVEAAARIKVCLKKKKLIGAA